MENPNTSLFRRQLWLTPPQVKGLRTLLNGVTHLPGRQQRLSNQMGDSFSKDISLQLMDSMSKGHDHLAVREKRGVERLWRGATTFKARRAMADRLWFLVALSSSLHLLHL